MHSAEGDNVRGEGCCDRRSQTLLISQENTTTSSFFSLVRSNTGGTQILLEANGHSEEEIQEVMIAGAFGTYIDIESAVTLGMLPVIPLNRFRQFGNAAGTGARMALASRAARKEAQNILTVSNT